MIASVLKPVNDTRTSEKIAQSLADTHQYEVHVLGVEGKTTATHNLHVHAHAAFNRLSLTRILLPWQIFQKIRVLRPALLVIATHELIVAALLLKVLLRCKIIYDVQENYYRNILHTPAFPLFVRPLLAFYVRIKEILSAPFIDHFFLAEKGYEKELGFVKNNFTVLENKLKRPPYFQARKKNSSTLLFSGTLAETTGVFKAIEVAEQLHHLDKQVTLTVAGFCPQHSTLAKIRNKISARPYIRLIGGDTLVAHEEILSLIKEADAGIISYPQNPSTINSIPTKLYEYLGYRLPILLAYHPVWTKICLPYAAAVVFDPANIDAAGILETLKKGHFYTKEPNDVFWDSEQPRLIREVIHLLN